MRTSVGQRVHVPELRGSGIPAMASTTEDLPELWLPAVASVGSLMSLETPNWRSWLHSSPVIACAECLMWRHQSVRVGCVRVSL